MNKSTVNNSRKFTNLVNDTGSSVNKSVKVPETNLKTLLNDFAKAWVNRQACLHVHVGVRLVGETITDNLCYVFQGKGGSAKPLFQQDCIGVPSDSLGYPLQGYYGQLKTQGSVLIHVGESSNYSKVWGKWGAWVWLRPLNDCPRISFDDYPIKSFFTLDFGKEYLRCVTYRELVLISRFISISKDKLPNELVKSRTDIIKNVSSDDAQTNIWDRERVSRYNIPGAIKPYMKLTSLGLLFSPNSNLRFQSAEVFFGPPEFSSNPSKVCNTTTHMLEYPQGEDNVREETKDTKGKVRNPSPGAQRRVRCAKKGGKTNQAFNSQPPPSKVKSQTEPVHRRGDYSAKHIRSGSLEDV